jgi:polyisoprenoid-binding protein YceI
MLKRSALCLALLVAPGVATAAPETYTIDPLHTFVHFETDHLGGMTRIRGRFEKVAGKFVIDRAARTGSMEVTVPTSTVNSGDNDKGSRPRSRDEHLRTPDFFNVAEFPTMAFRVQKVVFKGDAPAVLEGTATLLGVTRPLTLNVEHWRCGPHPGNKREMCGAIATGTLKRSDFGMKFGIPLVGDEQKLWISMEAFRD